MPVRLDRLQIDGRRLAALGVALLVVGNFLAFAEAVHAGLLDCRDVNENVISAAIGSNKAVALLRVEEFDGTDCH